MTFFEKGTKITSQTNIEKFEILHFSDNISKIIAIQNLFCSEKYLDSRNLYTEESTGKNIHNELSQLTVDRYNNGKKRKARQSKAKIAL